MSLTAAEIALILKAKDEASAVVQKFGSNVSALGGAVAAPIKGFADLGAMAAKLGIGVFGIQQLAGAVQGLGAAVVGGNAEFERYGVQLGVIMKSSAGAQARLEELTQFAQATPFELDQVVRADKILQGFGLQSTKAAELFGKSGADIRRIAGDVAAGSGASFEEMSTYLGKFSSGATGEAMERFQELGIVTRGQLAAMGVEFAKSGELVSPMPVAMTALLKIMEDKYGGMMQTQSQTFEGMASNISDWASNTQRKLSEPIFDGAKMGMQELLDKLNDPEFNASVDRLAMGISDAMIFGVVPSVKVAGIAIMGLPALMDAVRQDIQSQADNTGNTVNSLLDGIQQKYKDFNDALPSFLQSKSHQANQFINSQTYKDAMVDLNQPLIGPPAPPSSNWQRAWEEYSNSITNMRAQADQSARDRYNQITRDRDRRDEQAAIAKAHGAGTQAPPGFGQSIGAGGSASKAAAEMEKARDKAADVAVDMRKLSMESVAQLTEIGIKHGEAVNAAIDETAGKQERIREEAAKAISDLYKQYEVEKALADKRREFSQIQERDSLIRSRNLETARMELDYARQVAALAMDSFGQKQTTEDVARRRSREDEDRQRQLSRDLAKAKTEDEKKSIRERYDEETDNLAYRRRREDEDRQWNLSQELENLKEQHRQAVADLADKRLREDDDREYAKRKAAELRDFEDGIKKTQMEEERKRILAESAAKQKALDEELADKRKKLDAEALEDMRRVAGTASGAAKEMEEKFWNALPKGAQAGSQELATLLNDTLGATVRDIWSTLQKVQSATGVVGSVAGGGGGGSSAGEGGGGGGSSVGEGGGSGGGPSWDTEKGKESGIPGLTIEELFEGTYPGHGKEMWEKEAGVMDEGGITTRPTLAILSKNSRPEAVIPLDRMGAVGGLTVDLRGARFYGIDDAEDKIVAAIERAKRRGRI